MSGEEDKTMDGLVISAQEFPNIMNRLESYINRKVLLAGTGKDCPYLFCGECDCDEEYEEANGDSTWECTKYLQYLNEDIESILRGEPNERVLESIKDLYEESSEKPQVSVHD